MEQLAASTAPLPPPLFVLGWRPHAQTAAAAAVATLSREEKAAEPEASSSSPAVIYLYWLQSNKRPYPPRLEAHS